MILAALCCALITAGTQIRIPFFLGVPLTLQTPMIQVAALCLPAPYGIYSVLLYLLLGAAGFPVFAYGGGLAYFFEKTGGYLFGFLIATVPLQRYRSYWVSSRARLLASLFLHTMIIFVCGILWHANLEKIPLTTLFAAMTPFYIAAVVKLFFSLFLITALNRRLRHLH
jgi:biotin transport system substrate-specific component